MGVKKFTILICARCYFDVGGRGSVSQSNRGLLCATKIHNTNHTLTNCMVVPKRPKRNYYLYVRWELTPNDFPIAWPPQDYVLAVLSSPCDSWNRIARSPTSEHCIFLLLHCNIRWRVFVDDVWRHCNETHRPQLSYHRSIQLRLMNGEAIHNPSSPYRQTTRNATEYSSGIGWQ